MKQLKLNFCLVLFSLLTNFVSAQGFNLEPVPFESFYITGMDAKPPGTQVSYVLLESNPGATVQNYGVGVPPLFSVKSQSYNNGHVAKYHVISKRNYIVVKTIRVEGVSEYHYNLHLKVSRKDNDAANPVVSTLQPIPISYSNKILTTDNDESVYVFEVNGGIDAYSSINVEELYFTDETKAKPTPIVAQKDVAKNIRITLVVEEERYQLTSNPWNMDALGLLAIENNSYIHATWPGSNADNYPRPSYFELEWTFKDALDKDYSNFSSTITDDVKKLFEDQCSKIVTHKKSYKVLNSFPSEGRIYFRYRRVRPRFQVINNRAVLNPNFKEYSIWVYKSIEVKSGGGIEPMPESKKSWTLESNYAEGDLRKDIIQYFDGSGRPRLTLANMSENNNYVFSEQSLLDYEGNPVLQFLPTPLEKGQFDYVFKYKKINYLSTASSSNNSKDQYDKVGNYPGAISTNTSKSSKYYSSSNIFSSGDKHNFIPDAGGYPYSYTQIDNEGRPVKQTSPGAKFAIPTSSSDPDYTTSYDYSTPLQQELDILFGNNVGDASFYKKTIITDPNGQSSVTYTDGHGRTIATSILSIGNNHTLKEIDTKPTPLLLTEDLAKSSQNSVEGKTVTFSKEFTIDKNNTNASIDYSIDPNELVSCPGFCYHCAYGLKVTLKYPGDDGEVKVLYDGIYDQFQIQNDCSNSPTGKSFITRFNGTVPETPTQKRVLRKGTYTLTRVLTPLVERNKDMEKVLDDYLEFAKTSSTDNCSVRSLYSFQEEEINSIDFTECETDYELSPCANYKENMKREMTPSSGVYTKEWTANQIAANSGYPHYSIFNDASPNFLTHVNEDFLTDVNVLKTNNFIVNPNGVPNTTSYLPSFVSTYSGAHVTGTFNALNQVVTNNTNTNMLVSYENLENAPRTIELVKFDNIPAPIANSKGVWLELRVLPLFVGGMDFKLQVDIQETGKVKKSNVIDFDLRQIEVPNVDNWQLLSFDISSHLTGVVSDYSITIKEHQSAGGDHHVLMLDEIEVVEVEGNCSCSEWLSESTTPLSFTKRSVKNIKYPYQCLYDGFEKAKIKSATGHNPAELSIEEFKRQFSPKWLDEMIKLHPYYCKLAMCELVNGHQAKKFEADVHNAKTYQEAKTLLGLTNTELKDGKTLVNADPTFSNLGSNLSWLKTNMNSNCDKFYEVVDGVKKVDLSITKFAMFMSLADLMNDHQNFAFDQTTDQLITKFVNALGTNTALGIAMKKSGLEDVYWERVKRFYLGRRELLAGGIYSGTSCQGCNKWGLPVVSDFSDPANPKFGRHNVFPDYSSKNRLAKDIINDYINNSSAPSAVKNLSGNNNSANQNAAKNSLLSKLQAEKSSDCNFYILNQLKDYFPIVKTANGDEVLYASACSTGVSQGSSASILTSTLANTIDEVCDGTAIYNAANGTNPYEYIEKKFYAKGLFCSSSSARAKFERSPYLIDVSHALYDNNKLQTSVLSSDLMLAPTKTLPSGLAAPISGTILSAAANITNATEWASLISLIDGNAASLTYDQNSIPSPSVLGAVINISDFADFTKLDPSSVSIESIPNVFEMFLMDNKIETAGNFFFVKFKHNSQDITIRYLSNYPIYKLKPEKLLYGKVVRPEQKLTAAELINLMNNFLTDVVTLPLFKNMAPGSTANSTTLPKEIWDVNWPIMFTNYANFVTGREISFNDYKNAMFTNRTLENLNNSLTDAQLSMAFDFYKKTFDNTTTNGNSPVSICKGKVSLSSNFCSNCDEYYKVYYKYVQDNVNSVNFMVEGDIQNYFDNHTGFSASQWNATNYKVKYAAKNYVGEAANLYIIVDNSAYLNNQTSLKNTFKHLLVDGGIRHLYKDNNPTQNTVTVQGSHLFPDPTLNSTTNSGASCKFSHKILNNGYFSWLNSACFYDANLGLNYQGGSLQNPSWVHQNSDGTLWIHFNLKSQEEYKDIYLYYDMFNQDYTMADIESIVGIEPVYRKYGTTYEFELKVKLVGGREVKIPGKSDYPLAEVCVIPNVIAWDVPMQMRPSNEPNCEEKLYIEAFRKAETRYKEHVANVRDKFYADIVEQCSKPKNESAKLTYSSDMYHFTLYYYDQAGNLIQTVPPEGVRPLQVEVTDQNTKKSFRKADAQAMAAIKNHRFFVPNGSNTRPQAKYPPHVMRTKYMYNTLNNVIKKVTPDEGETKYYYDELGRLILSQNSKQLNSQSYSYTFYDELSRISEVGECPASAVAFNANNHIVANSDWLTIQTSIKGADRTHVVKTYYDRPFVASTGYRNQGFISKIENNQLNLKNRVTAMCFYETYKGLSATNPTKNAEFQNAIFYSYDVSGNVNRLWRNIQDVGLDIVKSVDYEYDLISGNVLYVHYQKGEYDELHHRYAYDSDNRIKSVEISRNGVTWEQDAEYDYYLHGPLARTVIGKNNVQGLDFVYTLQGWLKSVNGINYDVGTDGNTGGAVAKDVLSYALQYYNGDFSPIAISSGYVADAALGSMRNLYNGNIAQMDVKYAYENPAASTSKVYQKTYRYDQLNRIKEYAEPALNFTSSVSPKNRLLAQYSYDGNGNITKLQRNSTDDVFGKAVINKLDDFTYTYGNINNNLLTSITDQQPNYYVNGKFVGSVKQDYTYDNIGNLTKNHFERSSIQWNPIGKVKKVSTKELINQYADNTRRPLEMHNEYDPMGERIKKQTIDYNALPGGGITVIAHFNNGPNKTMVFGDKIPDEDDYNDDYNLWLYNQVVDQFGAILANDLTDPQPRDVIEGDRFKFEKKKENTEYFIRDAQGNILATYQRKIGIENSQENFAKLLQNAKSYKSYSDAQVKNKFIYSDLGLYTDFLEWTLPLFGEETDLPIDQIAIINNQPAIVLRLVNNFNEPYSQYFYENNNDNFKNLIKLTPEFNEFLLPFIAQEVENEFGPDFPQEEKDNITIERYEQIINSTDTPEDKYFKSEESGMEEFHPYVFDAIQNEVVYKHSNFKTMLISRLTSEPIYEEDMYVVASRGELFRLQNALNPTQYVDKLSGVSQYQDSPIDMVAEWMAMSEGYGVDAFLKRAKELNNGIGISDELLGLSQSFSAPNVFQNPYVMDLSEHHLYGSSRLGIMKREAFKVTDKVGQHIAGHTLFELTDHLGNVRNTVTDRTVYHDSKLYADVTEKNDYYPFGYKMDNRSRSHNTQQRHYQLFEAAKLNPIYVDKGTPVTMDLTQDQDKWHNYIYMEPNKYTPLKTTAWSTSTIYYFNTGVQNDSYFNQTSDNGDVCLRKIIPGGGKNFASWSMHKYGLPYSASTPGAVQEVDVSFKIRGENARITHVRALHNDATQSSSYSTPFNLPNMVLDKTQWVTATARIKITHNAYSLEISGVQQQDGLDAWIEVKDFKFQEKEISGYNPASETKEEEVNYRFGFNGMHREKEYNKGGEANQRIDYLWQDNMDQEIVFEDDLSDASQWIIFNGNANVPCAAMDYTSGAARLKLESSNSWCGIESKEFYVGKGKKYTLEVDIEKTAGSAQTNLYVYWQYYNDATASWVNINGVDVVGSSRQTISFTHTINHSKMRVKIMPSNSGTYPLLGYLYSVRVIENFSKWHTWWRNGSTTVHCAENKNDRLKLQTNVNWGAAHTHDNQAIKVRNKNKPHILTFDAEWLANLGPDVMVNVDQKDAGGGWSNCKTVYLTKQTAKKSYTSSFTPTKDYVRLYVTAYNPVSPFTPVEVYFDNFKISDGSTSSGTLIMEEDFYGSLTNSGWQINKANQSGQVVGTSTHNGSLGKIALQANSTTGYSDLEKFHINSEPGQDYVIEVEISEVNTNPNGSQVGSNQSVYTAQPYTLSFTHITDFGIHYSDIQNVVVDENTVPKVVRFRVTAGSKKLGLWFNAKSNGNYTGEIVISNIKVYHKQWQSSRYTNYDFGARIYDPRIARFFSIDPWQDKYPWQTPYAYYANTPIWKIDWKGYGGDPYMRKLHHWPTNTGSSWVNYGNASINGISSLYNIIPAVWNSGVANVEAINRGTWTRDFCSELKADYHFVSSFVKGEYDYATSTPITKQFSDAVNTYTSPFGVELLSSMAFGSKLPKLKIANSNVVSAKIESKVWGGSGEYTTVFRGVNSGTGGLAYKNASNGVVHPRGHWFFGHLNPSKHNSGLTSNSKFTSWTTEIDVARHYAFFQNGEGMLLEMYVPKSSLFSSPNNHRISLFHKPGTVIGESEVLLKGSFYNATSTKLSFQ